MALIATVVYFFDWENGVYLPIRVRLGGVTYESAPGDTFLKFEAQPGVYTIEMLLPEYTFQYWGTWPEYEDAILFEDIYANPTSITISALSHIYCIVIPEVLTEPQFVETYRDVYIYWLPALEIFRAQVAVGYIAVAPTLEEIYPLIDEILEFLEPPEDPEEGLFAQVVAAIQVWVNEVIGDRLQPVYDWIDNVLEGARTAWEGLVASAVALIVDVSGALTSLTTEVGDRWDTFTTLTLPDIWDSITTSYVNMIKYVDQVNINLNSFISNEFVDFAEWVRGLLSELDPHDFLPDPQGYIATAFNTLIAPWVEGIVKSFWEGLDEGLEE